MINVIIVWYRSEGHKCNVEISASVISLFTHFQRSAINNYNYSTETRRETQRVISRRGWLAYSAPTRHSRCCFDAAVAANLRTSINTGTDAAQHVTCVEKICLGVRYHVYVRIIHNAWFAAHLAFCGRKRDREKPGKGRRKVLLNRIFSLILPSLVSLEPR